MAATTAKSRKKKKRTRELLSDRLTTVLNSLTLSQLRTLAATFDIQLTDSRTFSAVVEAIISSSFSMGRILSAAYLVEASSPFKHVAFGRYEDEFFPPQGPEKFKSDHFGEIRYVAKNTDTSGNIFASFEHTVIVEEWQISDDGEHKNLIRRNVRHPIIVRFMASTQNLTISFPGFSHGGSWRKRDCPSYEMLVVDLSEILSTHFGVKFRGVPVKAAIDELTKSQSHRAVITRAKPMRGSGSILVDSLGELSSVEDLFLNILRPHLPSKFDILPLRRAFQQAVRSSSLNSVFVYWRLEEIITRITYWDSGVEFLIIWHKTDRSYVIIDQILTLILRVLQQFREPSRIETWNKLLHLSADEVVLPSAFSSKFGLSKEETKELFLAASDLLILEPVFKLRTDEVIEGFVNAWTPNMSTLARDFRTISGLLVDGRKYENIEIAFRRTSQRGGEE